MSSMNCSDVVKKLKAKGFTQREIGSYVGISQVAVSKLERGETTDPRASVATALRSMLKEKARRR